VKLSYRKPHDKNKSKPYGVGTSLDTVREAPACGCRSPIALYMESLNGWSPSGTVWESQGWASNGTVCEVPTCGLWHCMGNPKRASPGLSLHCLYNYCTRLRGPICAVLKIPKGPVLTSLWHCIAISDTTA